MKARTIALKIVECPARRTAVRHARVRISELHSFFNAALTAVLEAMETEGTVPGGEPFAYYHAMQDGVVDVEAGFPTVGNFRGTEDVVPGELPAGSAVTGLHLGPYSTLGDTYAEMTAWAVAHGRQPTGEIWEVYLSDPERETDPELWRTGVFLRVK